IRHRAAGAFHGRLCRSQRARWATRPRRTRGGRLQNGGASSDEMTLTENIPRAVPIKAAADPDHVLDLRKVCKQFGTDPVVNALIDVDLVLRRGEWLSITGPSGSGKSTLLNVLGCLDRPTRGTYLFDCIETTTR